MITRKDKAIKIKEDISNNNILLKICNKFKINKEDIISWNISKKSIDARKKDDVHYNYSIDIKVKNENHLVRLPKIRKIFKN